MASLTTSYFAVARRLKGKKISTARFNNPKIVGSLDSALTSFAPSVELLQKYKNGKISWNEYVRQYHQEQKHHYQTQPDDFRQLLQRATVDDVILLCYEKYVGQHTQCHRMLLYDMLKKIAKREGYNVNFVDEAVPVKTKQP